MGRYYSGDIEGKFWFGVQSSIAADRFGVTHNEPSYVEYYFSEEDLDGVEEEIERITENLGEKLITIKKFFEENIGYRDEDLLKIGINRFDLNEYADLMLGIEIRDCIKQNGSCHFEAEL